jgi:subtilisin-like proprotein convertase family protein
MNMMKTKMLAVLLSCAPALTLPAALWSAGSVNGSGTSLNQVIPDANLSGYAFSMNVSGENFSLTDINVTLNFSGGFNGDLYAYLSYGGTKVELLNRVGTGLGVNPQFTFGYSTAGMNNIILDDSSPNGSIHNVATPAANATYTPDGGSLASFNTMNPNGSWTLFFADKSGGNVTTLEGWSLDISAVPEPTTVALGIVGGIGAVGWLVRWRKAQKQKFGNKKAEMMAA